MVLTMTTDEKIRSDSVRSTASGTLTIPNDKHCLTKSIPPSPTIGITASSRASSNRSLRKKHTIIDIHNLRQNFKQKQTVSIEVTVADLSQRLRIRKYLQTRLAFVSDILCFLAIVGILLMVIENELTFDRIDNHDTKASWFIKLIITVTTLILLILIMYYHYLDLKLYSNQNSLKDCRLGLTNMKICLIIFELLICAMHPIPLAFPYTDPPKLNTTDATPYALSYISVDVALGLPMFFRVYLFGRSIMYHSRLVRNTSLRSVGYLNRVSIDFFFLMKTYLEQWPTRCLLTLCTIVFLSGSWSFRACNYMPTGEHISMLDGMWLFMTTFTTVGYGDIFPSSYCGRLISAIVGLFGILVSTLLIAVVAQKLLLTRQEKYVHTFVSDTVLAKKRQHQAANIIKFAIKVWYLKRKNKSKLFSYFQSQRKLFYSIYHLQEIKQEQKKLTDNYVGLHELMTVQRNINTQHDETIHEITNMKGQIKNLEDKINNMTNTMETLQTSLKILVENMTKQTNL